MILIQPFGFSRIEIPDRIFHALGHGISSSFILSLFYYVVPLVSQKQFKADKWNIGKQLIFIITFLFCLAFVNWGYHYVFNLSRYQSHTVFSIIGLTFSIGLFPSVILILLIERQSLKKDLHEARFVSPELNYMNKSDIYKCVLEILSGNLNDKIRLFDSQILCIKAMGNYSVIYYTEDNRCRSKILRNTLKNIEEQLKNCENMIRCHKSFIINMQNVNSVSGNARGYMLNVPDLKFRIPISRNSSQSVLEMMDHVPV
jgi:hypothetical protein